MRLSRGVAETFSVVGMQAASAGPFVEASPPPFATAEKTYGQEEAKALWLEREADRLAPIEKAMVRDGMLLTRGSWTWPVKSDQEYRLTGMMEFRNMTSKKEVFVPEVAAKCVLLGRGDLSGVEAKIKLIARHDKEESGSRPDNYWRAYILKARASTRMQVEVQLQAPNGATLDLVTAAWVRVKYVAYGPHGRTHLQQNVVLPLQFPPPLSEPLRWQRRGAADILPIPTHLLCHLDDPLSIMQTYILPHAQPGDVLALAESPLAIMQGRIRHPETLRVSLLARLVCLCFHPTSSLATACGTQALIDLAGPVRIFFAAIIGILGRLVGVRGMFYNVAGDQARLIDDVTGTLPPYDQFICLGPVRSQETVDALRDKTGMEVAIVDVNDLQRVQILAASRGVDGQVLTEALRTNPAGNAEQQTPLVLVRPRRNDS
eukprot:jgi/Chlat1/6210/Chrsp44S05807